MVSWEIPELWLEFFRFFFGPTSSKIGEVPAMFSYKKGHVPSSSSIPTLDGK
jgi:hypothetical protein